MSWPITPIGYRIRVLTLGYYTYFRRESRGEPHGCEGWTRSDRSHAELFDDPLVARAALMEVRDIWARHGYNSNLSFEVEDPEGLAVRNFEPAPTIWERLGNS